MDERFRARRLCCGRDLAGADGLDRRHIGKAADEVDHRFAAGRGAGNAACIAHIGGYELRLAQPAERLQKHRLARVALRDPHAGAARQKALDDIAAQKAAAAEHRDQLPAQILHHPCLSCRFSKPDAAASLASPCREAPEGASAKGGAARARATNPRL